MKCYPELTDSHTAFRVVHARCIDNMNQQRIDVRVRLRDFGNCG